MKARSYHLTPYKRHLSAALRILLKKAVRCACGKEAFYSDRRKRVDHDHISGAVRGIVCCSCNIRIGTVEAPMDIGRYVHIYRYLVDHRKHGWVK